MSKKEIKSEIPESPMIQKAAKARARKAKENPKKAATKKKPRGQPSFITKWTDAEIKDVKEKYFDHLAQGFPITSFHYKCSYKTLRKMILERPDMFPAEELEMIKSRRYHTMITIGMQQAQGQIEKGNVQSWKILMYNMFGWKDKVESKQEMSVEDQFRAAVQAQNAREIAELEEVKDTEDTAKPGSEASFD